MPDTTERRMSREDYLQILATCETKADLVALISRLLMEVRSGSSAA